MAPVAWGSGEQGREGRHAGVLSRSPAVSLCRAPHALQCVGTAGDFGKGGAELGHSQGGGPSRGGLVFGRFLLGVPLLPWSGGGKVPMPLSRVRNKEPQAGRGRRDVRLRCLSPLPFLASCPVPRLHLLDTPSSSTGSQLSLPALPHRLVWGRGQGRYPK